MPFRPVAYDIKSVPHASNQYSMIDRKDPGEPDLPPPPQEPHPDECCGRGCERCVYVYYEEAVQRWEERVALLKEEYQSGTGAQDHGCHTNDV